MLSRAVCSWVKFPFLSALLTFIAPTAHAETINARVFVSYEAPPTCPDRGAFIAQLESRIPRDVVTTDQNASRRASVTLTAAGELFLGHVELTDNTGIPATRSVSASRCEDAVSAMALVTALALEAQGARQSLPAATSAKPIALEQTQISPEFVTLPPERSKATAASSVQPRTAPIPRAAWAHEASMGLGLLRQVVGPGIAMGVGIEWGFGRRTVIPPFRLGATWSDNRRASDVLGGSDATRYRLLAAKAQLCSGLALVPTGLLSASLCLGAEFGQYRAAGVPSREGGATGHDYGMFWSSVVSDVHLRIEASPVFFDFAPQIRAPLIRREFLIRGTTEESYRIPSVALGVHWSLGIIFR